MNHDIDVLAGRFPNRRGTTEVEGDAAGYLLGRFKSYSPFAYMDSFFCSESYFLLFAMYYGEFLVLSILAIWAPLFATFYGVFIFVAYLIECSGLQVISRLISPAESQNVVAPFHATNPKRLLVVCAGYDTQVEGVLSKVLRSGYTHWWHRGILLLMIVVIVATAAEGMGVATASIIPWWSMLRWSAVSCLCCAGIMVYFHDRYGDDVRGANNNASGVGVLLTLAEELNEEPLEHSDVWLVGLGNSYGSSEGIGHVLRSAPQDKSEIRVITLQGVGCGALHYLSKEGLMHPQGYDKALQDSVAQEAGLESAIYRGLPTPGHWASQHGYAALTLMGIEDNRDAPHAWSDSDRLDVIDPESMIEATDIVRGLLKALDSTP